MAPVPHRINSLHPSRSPNKLPLLHPAPARLLCLRSQPARYTQPVPLRSAVADSHVAVEEFKERSIISSLSNIWILPWLVALVTLPGSAKPWIRYALLSGLLSYPYCHAILVGWNAKKSNSVRTRAVSAAFYNMFVQSGNIIATNVYRDDDQPLDRRGNKILLGICVWNVFLFYAVKAFYVWRYRVRERQWNAMTKGEQEDYVVSTKDQGMKRLDFRFVH
jgi:hypothetical protein